MRFLATTATFRIVLAGLLALPAAPLFAVADLVAAASFFWTIACLISANLGNPRAPGAAAPVATAVALAAFLVHFGTDFRITG